jgi:cyclic pyranopterin phosphate synthase
MNAIDYLRISLIDRCNFQCQYCMPEGADLTYALQQDWLTRAELRTLLQQVFIPVGFTRFRLTGGEPLLRPDVVEIVDDIAQLTPDSRPGDDDQCLFIGPKGGSALASGTTTHQH